MSSETNSTTQGAGVPEHAAMDKGKGKAPATEDVSMDEEESSSDEEAPVSCNSNLQTKTHANTNMFRSPKVSVEEHESGSAEILIIAPEEPEEADEDNMEEIDESNIISGGRRTRGKDIDFAKAAELVDEDDKYDEDEDDDFEDPDDEMKE